ncbi:MAG: hypothetical protein ACM3VW_09795 [Bacteroidota bacterium]
MKRDEQDRLQAMARRNESDMRMVGGIVGVLSGGFLAFAVEMRFFRYSGHTSALVLLIIPLIAAIIGGIIGYFKDTWRSSL